MEFCPECGSRLELKKVKGSEGLEVVLACCKCEYRKTGGAIVRPKVSEIMKTENKKAVTVISKEDQKLSTLPTLKVECPKCGNNLVYVWQVQTRGGDESSTQFMRCTKCDHTFREYT